MKDPLANLYTESVAKPTKLTKKIDFGKDQKVGSKVDEDLGAGKAGVQKNTGPEAADGFEKKKSLKEETEMNDNKEVQEVQETNEPEVGSQFDALFSRAIKEDFDPSHGGTVAQDDDMSFGGDTGGDEFGGSDEFSDDEPAGEEVDLRSALTNIIDQLQDILSNVEGGDDSGMDDADPSDVEDLDMQRNFSNDEENREGLEDQTQIGEASAGMDKARDGKIRKAPDGKSTLQGKGNKVGGYFGKSPGKGATGDAGGDKPRDGKLRPAPSYTSLQGKDNKVKQSGVPGRQGASLFD